MFAKVIKLIMVLSVCSSAAGQVYGVTYEADRLDKLFTDKAQRMQIDAARSGGVSVSNGIKKVSKVKVNGYVTRSGGKSVVWVNDNSTLESTGVDGVRVHQSTVGKNKKVTISVDGKQKRLRPGEVWNRETDKVGEDF